MLLEHGLEVSELNKDKYVCGECGRNCMNRYNLENYIAAYNCKYDCERCGKKLQTRKGFKYHINICVADFTTSASLSVDKIDKQPV